ncbi:BrnT family toxin [Roseibium sp.]
MKFEYDPDKSAANREKHGIDFDEAQALWDDPYLIEAPANVTDEPRFLAVGMIGARH